MNKINDDVQIGDFLWIYSEVETSKTPTESDTMESVENKNNTEMGCSQDEKANDHDAEINKALHNEILKSF